MYQYALPADRGKQPDLGGADDGAGPDRDITGLHVIARAPYIRPRPHAAQHPNPGTTAVGPAQRQYRVGERRHRRAGLDPRRLTGLQPARGPLTRLDQTHHRQADLAVGRRLFILVALVLRRPAETEHIDAAHRVAVDRSLIETRQRTLGDHLFGAHQALGFGDRHPNRARCHRSRGHSSLLLLNRTHNMPFSPEEAPGRRRPARGGCARRSSRYCSADPDASPSRSINHRRNSGP